MGEIADFYTGNGLSWNDISENGNQECILYGNLYTDYGMITDTVVYRTDAEIKSPVYSEFGDVLIPASDTTPTGLARATSIEKSGVLLGGDINIVRPKNGINGSCLSLAINANKSELIKLIKGTTVRHIHNSEIQGVTVSLPADLREQETITDYFKDLDRLITLHQRKYEKLHNIKKSMLEKMFPQNGSNVPEIRFKGFTDAWEQRKLGEVVKITSGFMGDSLLTDGMYHLTRIETIADGIVDENRVGYSNKKPDDMYLLKHGDILYSNINSISHMGKVAKYQGNSLLYHGINLLRLQPENNIDSNFLLYLLSTEKCRNWAKTRANQAVSQASINQSLLATQEIAISSLAEQKQIGEYFRNLDRLITLHQRELEKLQNIKKSMLEKMFV